MGVDKACDTASCRKTKAKPVTTAVSGVEQRPLARSPVHRHHSIAEMVAEGTRCFVPELMPCLS